MIHPELSQHIAIQNPLFVLEKDLTQIELKYDQSRKALWVYMKGSPVPCFTHIVLKELNHVISEIQTLNEHKQLINYVVGASLTPGIYNLGGDLKLFHHCVINHDKETLKRYAYACIDLGHACAHMLYKDITTIALLEGNAFGGGLEGALSCNIVIAEERVRLGFPEILFNMFPGMGAYTYLRHRIHMTEIEKLLTSGRNYTAEEFYKMGLIDVLAEDGKGPDAADEAIDEYQKRRGGRIAIHKAKMIADPINLEELYAITDLWIDTALDLDPKSLNTMDRLFRAQLHRARKKQ